MIKLTIIILGLTLGSFANNLISYFSGKSGFDFFRSSCFCGEKTLSIAELLPLVNYVMLRGKCKTCRKTIPFRYPAIELLVTLIAFLTYLQCDITILFVVNFLTYLIFLVIAVVDYYSYIIPNLLVVSLLILSVVNFAILPVNIELNVASAVVIVLVFILIHIITQKLLKKETIGYGDIKLISVSFLLLGFPLQFIWLWLSALIAIPGFYLLKLSKEKFKDEKRIPFGFFLSLAFIITRSTEQHVLNFFYWLTQQ